MLSPQDARRAIITAADSGGPLWIVSGKPHVYRAQGDPRRLGHTIHRVHRTNRKQKPRRQGMKLEERKPITETTDTQVTGCGITTKNVIENMIENMIEQEVKKARKWYYRYGFEAGATSVFDKCRPVEITRRLHNGESTPSRTVYEIDGIRIIAEDGRIVGWYDPNGPREEKPATVKGTANDSQTPVRIEDSEDEEKATYWSVPAHSRGGDRA